MNDENSELNDIILNRNERSNSRKKMLVSIAVLAIVLIVIVVIMGKLSSSHPAQLPQPVLPGEKATAPGHVSNEASEESAAIDEHLNEVAEKVKAKKTKTKPVTPPKAAVKKQTKHDEIVIIDETTPAVTTIPARTAPKTAAVKPKPVPKPHAKMADTAPIAPVVTSGSVYIQVGSFRRYEPNKKFLARIERSGYRYRYYRVVVNGSISNKVLVGPFRDRADAKSHLTDVRKKIESGAFVYTIKP